MGAVAKVDAILPARPAARRALGETMTDIPRLGEVRRANAAQMPAATAAIDDHRDVATVEQDLFVGAKRRGLVPERANAPAVLAHPGPREASVLGAFDALLRRIDPISGRARPEDIATLAQRVGAIDSLNKPVIAAAAKDLLGRVSFDRQIDASDRDDLLEAIATLKAWEKHGPSLGTLRRAIDAALVQPVNVVPSKLVFDLDVRAVRDPAVSEFPAVSRLTLPTGALSKLRLDVDAERLTVTQVLADGVAVPFHVQRGRLEVTAPGAKTLEVRHSVRAAIVTKDEDFADAHGLIIDRRNPDDIQVLSLLWPYHAGKLFPANPTPPAALAIQASIAAPEGFTTLASNVTQLVPAYSAAVRASNNLKTISGPLTQGGVRLNFVVNRDGGLRPDGDFSAALVKVAAGLDHVEGILGMPYPGRVIDFVQTTSALGGMEHQGMPAISDASIADQSRVNGLVAVPLHEAIHGYFGNGDIIDGWASFTMSEGVTQYLTYRGLEASLGLQGADEAWVRSRELLARSLARKPQPLVAPVEGDVNAYFSSVPYELGAWSLRMAEQRLGRERFDALLGELARDNFGKPISVSQWADFLTSRTAIDFVAFYRTWGTLSGVPSYQVTVTPDGNTLALNVRSLGVRLPKGTTIPVRVEGEGGQTAMLQIDPGVGQFIDGGLAQTVEVGFPVRHVVFDPQHTVLAVAVRAENDSATRAASGG